RTSPPEGGYPPLCETLTKMCRTAAYGPRRELPAIVTAPGLLTHIVARPGVGVGPYRPAKPPTFRRGAFYGPSSRRRVRPAPESALATRLGPARYQIIPHKSRNASGFPARVMAEFPCTQRGVPNEGDTHVQGFEEGQGNEGRQGEGRTEAR